jgi:uncharacterized protein (UPF0276 family)
MELSVNYSREAEQLLREGKIRFDRFKCADWSDMIATARELLPVYVHFPLDAGSRAGRPANYHEADALARQTDTPFVNLHLVSYSSEFPDQPADSDDPQVLATVTDRMLADIAAAGDAVGGRERVIVENIPFYGRGSKYHRASVELGVIRRVVDESGCGFLLDLSHARIAAHYLGVEPRLYVQSLPVDRLRELHVTGVREHDGRLTDHMDFRDEDWTWAAWAFEQIRAGRWATPWTVALEYGGIGEPFKWRSDARLIEEQVPRLLDMVRGATRR